MVGSIYDRCLAGHFVFGSSGLGVGSRYLNE